MRFASAARRTKYVVVPKRTFSDDREPEPGLMARFRNNVFDSEKTQRDLGWTDEQRIRVEKHLLGHPDFDKPGGFFLDTATTGGKSKADILREAGHPWAEAYADGSGERCMFFYADPDKPGEVAQCASGVMPGSDYCESHQPESVTDEQGPAPDVTPVLEEPVREPEPVASGWSMPPIGG